MRSQKVLLFFLTLALSTHINDAYRILCLFPYNGKSHFIVFEALCKGLASKGHQIDMISHFPTKKPIPNYTDIIDLSGTRKAIVSSFTIDFAKILDRSLVYYLTTDFGSSYCHLMGNEKMQKFIKNPPNDPPYDLIITEYFASPCYLGFGHLLNAPVAIAVSFLEMPYIDNFMGSPFNYGFFSGHYNDYPVVDTFLDRLWNFIVNYKEEQKFYYYTSDQTDLMRKYLDLPNLPDIRELERNVSLAIVNSHHSYHGIRAVTPAIVEVGGIHIVESDQKVNPELKEWLDSANHGLVYFSMGSILAIEEMSKEMISIFYQSFAKISPIKVLIRCANSTKLPPGLPSNAMTLSWIPQIAVLRHKNTRVFITHGGFGGTQEAIYYGVPMIGIPVFSDQKKNIYALAQKNMAVALDIDNINEDIVNTALDAVLHDPKYRESAKKISKMFKDRPMSAIDTAIYWIEYVIRNGPQSLRSHAVDLPWWKLYLIDVFVFLIACFVLTIYLLVTLLKILFGYLFNIGIQTKRKTN